VVSKPLLNRQGATSEKKQQFIRGWPVTSSAESKPLPLFMPIRLRKIVKMYAHWGYAQIFPITAPGKPNSSARRTKFITRRLFTRIFLTPWANPFFQAITPTNVFRTKLRVFYGNRQKKKILDHFTFPFIAKIPRGSALGSGVYLIHNEKELSNYLEQTSPAYVQAYLPIDRDIRVVVIGRRVVHAYWRIAPPNEFRSNVAVGGRISLKAVPEKARDLALQVARACGWNDVGIDISKHKGHFYVLEANMKYGKEGFRKAGLDYDQLMESMIENEEI
jgi:ribosomal protein S6--L-glutamate ligase